MEGWIARAACRGQAVAAFFPERPRGRSTVPSTTTAADLCSTCAVVAPCLHYATETRAVGVWAGRLCSDSARGGWVHEPIGGCCAVAGCARPVAPGLDWCDAHRPGGCCAVGGCPAPVVARGWCRLHYQRWRVHGRPTDDAPLDPTRQRCATPGCPWFVNSHGLCFTCEKRADRSGALTRRPALTAEQRFASRLLRDGDCLLFQGGSDAYGQWVVDGAHLRPRRYAWEMATGKKLKPGTELQSSCGNPRCCELSHLVVSPMRLGRDDAATQRVSGTPAAALSL